MEESRLDGQSVQAMCDALTKLIMAQGAKMGLYPSPLNSQAQINKARADLARYVKELDNRRNPLKAMGYDREWK